jgi:hypothetical protein
MLRVRSALVLAAMVALVAISQAQFQPGRAVTPTPLAVVLLSSIDDENVVAELKLSEEQVKTLVAHRKKGQDEQYTTAPKAYAEGEVARAAATDALLKKTLTPAQYQRAAQLGAQRVLRIFGLGRVSVETCNHYPELLAVCKLTDEQKKQLTDRNRAGILLTSEQLAAVREFLGPRLENQRSVQPNPRQLISNRATPPRDFSLLAAKDVRAEVKLTEKQEKALAPSARSGRNWQPIAKPISARRTRKPRPPSSRTKRRSCWPPPSNRNRRPA